MVIASAHMHWLGRGQHPLVAKDTIDWRKLTVAAHCGCCVHC